MDKALWDLSQYRMEQMKEYLAKMNAAVAWGNHILTMAGIVKYNK